MGSDERDKILEADAFFAKEDLRYAKRIWNNLLSVVEDMEEEMDPWAVQAFIVRVAQDLAARDTLL
jgi:hypothetical protein